MSFNPTGPGPSVDAFEKPSNAEILVETADSAYRMLTTASDFVELPIGCAPHKILAAVLGGDGNGRITDGLPLRFRFRLLGDCCTFTTGPVTRIVVVRRLS